MSSRHAEFLPILTYHGIRRAAGQPIPAGWSRRHAVTASAFVSQLDAIVSCGLHTVRLADLGWPAHAAAITFDDGHASDYTIAAPELSSRGLAATFFITASYLGRRGYLERAQVRELHARSFEIGSHGLTHKRLTEMGPAELWREALDSRRRLEDLIGHAVSSFALPSGSYDDAVLQALWAAGYRRIMTSDFGYATRRHSVMHRMGVMADTDQREFNACLAAGPGWAVRRRLFKAIQKRLGLRVAGARGGAPALSTAG